MRLSGKSFKQSLVLFFFLAASSTPALTQSFASVDHRSTPTIEHITPRVESNITSRTQKLYLTLQKTPEGQKILTALKGHSTTIVYQDLDPNIKGQYIHNKRTIYLNQNLPEDFDDLILSNECAHAMQLSAHDWATTQMPEGYLMTCLLFEGDSFAQSMAYLHAAKKSGRNIEAFLKNSPTNAALFKIYEDDLVQNKDNNSAKNAVMKHWIGLGSSLAYASMILDDLGLLTRHRDDFKQRYDLTKKWDAGDINIGRIRDYMTTTDIEQIFTTIKSKDGIAAKIAAYQADVTTMHDEKIHAAKQAALIPPAYNCMH